jgi:hypothetical protein
LDFCSTSALRLKRTSIALRKSKPFLEAPHLAGNANKTSV